MTIADVAHDLRGLALDRPSDPFAWPSFGYVDDVRCFIEDAVAQAAPLVVATLVRVEGGGPRPAGTQMVFTEDALAGYLSGGCVEADLTLQAREVLRQGSPRKVIYGRGSPYFDIQLMCGSRIEIMLERIAASDIALERLMAATRSRRPALWISDGLERHCLGDDDPVPRGWNNVVAHARQSPALAGEIAGSFWRRFRPAVRIYVMGRDPVAMATATLAAQVGFETVLVRPGGPSTPPPFAVHRYWRGEFPSALESLGADDRTAIVVANHDAEADLDALKVALISEAPYVGVLGSRRHKIAREKRLLAHGVTAQQMSRLRSPIGLRLGGKTPWSIALSIVAEIVSNLEGAAFDSTEVSL